MIQHPQGILLTVEQAQQLVDYLATRPYKEVFQLLPMLLRGRPGWGGPQESEQSPLQEQVQVAS